MKISYLLLILILTLSFISGCVQQSDAGTTDDADLKTDDFENELSELNDLVDSTNMDIDDSGIDDSLFE